MKNAPGILGTLAGVALAVGSWFVAHEYAPAVTALLLVME